MTEAAAIRLPESDPVSGPAYDKGLHWRFIHWKDQCGLSVRDIAREVGVDKSEIKRYIDRPYSGLSREVEARVARLLAKPKTAPDSMKRGAVLCETAAARALWEVCEFCERDRRMGLGVAPSGSGKTQVARARKETRPDTVLVTANLSTRHPGNFLRMMTSVMEEKLWNRTSIGVMIDDVIRHMRRSERLIIVDDGHFLSWETFECLRAIHDGAEVGIAIFGQERTLDQMRGGTRTGMLFDQILSRLSIRRTVIDIRRVDVKLIAESVCPGLDRSCVDFLFSIAQGQGRFRVVVNLLDVAAQRAKEEGCEVDLPLLRHSASFLWGPGGE